MPNRALTGLLLALLAAACSAPAPREPASESRRESRPRRIPPNVVLFLADDLGWGELGVQGGKDIPTPNIDSLARDGVRCTDGYVTAPLCAPTRAGLLTGRYGQRFGFEHNPGPPAVAAPDFGLPEDQPTLAERFREAGTATGLFGKWHLGYREEARPTRRGFEEFVGFLAGAHAYLPRSTSAVPLLRGTEAFEPAEYLTDLFAREAAEFIGRHRARPFFLYLPFNAVHAPLQAPEARLERFASLADPRRQTFAAMLAAMDDAVGRVLAKLREEGLEERTLVFFLSDNGGPTGRTTSSNGPLRGAKGQVYEGGIRVPYLVRWKGTLPAGGVFRRPVSSLDVAATALAAAGLATEGGASLDGVDLLPFLTRERSDDPHPALFWRMGPQSAARVGDWKLVVRGGGEAQLFDLASDIGENVDLAARDPERLAELRRAYDAWNAENVPARWPPARAPGRVSEPQDLYRVLEGRDEGELSSTGLDEAGVRRDEGGF